MDADVERIVNKFQSRARKNPTNRYKRKLQLFRAAAPLEFVAMDIHGPFPTATQENKYILFVTDRYSEIARAINSSKTTRTHISNLFFDHCLVLYGIHRNLLIENGV